MGQCASHAQQIPLYLQIPRDLATNVYYVKEGYTDTLDVDDVRLTARRIKRVRQLLRSGTHTTSSSVSNSSSSSSSSSSFETMLICYCTFMNAQAQQELVQLIQDCRTLKTLYFQHNELRGWEPGITNLGFLIQALRGKSLEEVELSDRTLYGSIGEAFLRQLVENVSMKHLLLKYMSLDIPTIRGLSAALQSPHCRVQELTMRECWIDDTMLETLVTVLCDRGEAPAGLTRLDLESNSFSPAALVHLTRLLKDNHTVQHLVLDRNENIFFGADPDEAEAWGNALATNTTLQFLSLTLTDLGDTVAMPLFRALEKNTTLMHLELDETFVSLEGYKQFIKSLPHMKGLREISIGWDSLFEEFPEDFAADAMKAFARNTSVTRWCEVSLYYHEEYDAKLRFYLARNMNLAQTPWPANLLPHVAARTPAAASAVYAFLQEHWESVIPKNPKMLHVPPMSLSTENCWHQSLTWTDESSTEEGVWQTYKLDGTDVEATHGMSRY